MNKDLDQTGAGASSIFPPSAPLSNRCDQAKVPIFTGKESGPEHWTALTFRGTIELRKFPIGLDILAFICGPVISRTSEGRSLKLPLSGEGGQYYRVEEDM